MTATTWFPVDEGFQGELLIRPQPAAVRTDKGLDRIVERVGAYDGTLLLATFGWALTIVFLPFATLLSAEFPSTDRLAVAVYIGTIALSSIFLATVGVLVWRRPVRRSGGRRWPGRRCSRTAPAREPAARSAR